VKDNRNYNLKAHNTFGIDASCSRFIEYASVEEAQAVAAELQAASTPYIIIGGGSNLLLTQDFNGIVVHSAIMGREHRQESDGIIVLRAGSGETWDEIVDYCVTNGWHGAENLSLIPGEVGASAVQNIGAYGVEAKDLIVEVEAVEIASGRLITIPVSDCGYGYRDSRFKHEWKNRYLVTHVSYRLSAAFEPKLDYGNIREELAREGIDSPTARQLRDTIIGIRNAKLPDPKVEGNAGSFFMNPVVGREKYDELAARYGNVPHYETGDGRVKIPAGWMIDQCGWKGKSMGHAGVHSKQALVLVNRGGATGGEIVALCETIRRDVNNRFGIDIQPEVNIV
jgi:UDP-N-acetylmuramate dehydrogenase